MNSRGIELYGIQINIILLKPITNQALVLTHYQLIYKDRQ